MIKLLFCVFLALGAASAPITAEEQGERQTSRLFNLLKLKSNPAKALETLAAKGNFTADVRKDSRKVIVTHNKETAQVTFPYSSYGEFFGDFDGYDLFFNYDEHFFHVDLSQKGKINIKKTLEEILTELVEIQEMYGEGAISWSSGKTKKYSYIDFTLAFMDEFYSDEDAIDFDLENSAKDFASDPNYSDSSFFGEFTAKFRIIVSNKNIFTLGTFYEEEGAGLHEKFIRSFELK